MRAWEGAREGRDTTRTGGEAPGERARAGHDGEADPVNGSTQQSPSFVPFLACTTRRQVSIGTGCRCI